MTGRWLPLTSGLVISTFLVSAGWSQVSKPPSSLADRMSALRRGWSQGQSRPNQGNAANAPHDANEFGEEPESRSNSLWPGIFRRRNDRLHAQPGRNGAANRVPARAGAAHQPGPQNQRTGDTALAPRIATRPRTGSVQAAAPRTNNSATLPGLGGSPLPRTESAPAGASLPGGTQVLQEATSDYAPYGSSASSRTTASGAVRQSPHRRTAPQIDPDELRRELTGVFPASPNTAGASLRTARAGASTAGNEPQGDSIEGSNADESGLKRPASSRQLTLPADDGAPFSISDSPANSPTDDEHQRSPTNDNDSAATPDNPLDSRDGFGTALGGSFTRSNDRNGRPAGPTATLSSQATDEIGIAGQQDAAVLVSNQTPIITTHIRGPKQILVGREATYQVHLHNAGDIEAEGIVANIRIPSWAEVVGTSSTQGMVQKGGDATGAGQLDWQLTRVEARGSETLDIRLIPRASRPLELGVSWTLTPIGSRAIVEVQEPKLQMTVSGPDEVLFSKPQVFRLTLSNPGTGVAENVKIDLMPPGGGESVVTSHPIGNLAPGASKTVEVELTANEAGKLFVKASATAEGGLSSVASKEIFCRKPELEVDWRGPDEKYAGTPATYFFRVRNPGTAPAENVTLHVTLPVGAEFTSASEGQTYDAKRREVEWQVGTLRPGDDSYLELKCVANTPGVNQYRITAAAASANLTASKTAETTIIALADLKLEVSDPSGPVAVGSPAIYEIRVNNRGADTAKDVNIVALFSEGIEPEQVEGGMYTVADGRVNFRTIEELQAGREIVLRIRARAATAGTHVFRAEVVCRDLEIKLAAEETTRFYAEDAPQQGDGTNSEAENFSSEPEATSPIMPTTATSPTRQQYP